MSQPRVRIMGEEAPAGGAPAAEMLRAPLVTEDVRLLGAAPEITRSLDSLRAL